MRLPVRAEMIDHLTIILEDCNNQAHWRKHAACRGMDTNLFYPEQGYNGHAKQRQAQAVCAACPVKAECLQALDGTQVGLSAGKQQQNAHANT